MQVDAHFSSPESRALLSRIRRRHATVTEQLHIGLLKIHFTRIADPNRVLDEVAEAEDLRDRLEGKRRENPLHLPYWAELWDSAMGLAHFVVGAGSPRPDGAPGDKNEGGETPPLQRWRPDGTGAALRILELGCGMGLCGTVAAALGHNVLFADLEAEALLFARLNSLPWARNIRTRRLNWQTDRLGERFDLILGADILYENGQWEHLDKFWAHHLKDEGAILLAEPGRQTGTLFLDWIDKSKWSVEQHAQSVETRSTPIRIFQLGRKSP